MTFWDRVAGVYDLFADVYNGKVNRALCETVLSEIRDTDIVLECACGTGMISKRAAAKCAKLIATDFSEGMLKQTRRKCRACSNVEVRYADITKLDFEDESFDVVIAANVIHLLDEPCEALKELDRVCRSQGRLIIPTYVNDEKNGRTSGFAKTVDQAGADFKKQFTFASYRDFLERAGYADLETVLIRERVPCAVAVIRKQKEEEG